MPNGNIAAILPFVISPTGISSLMPPPFTKAISAPVAALAASADRFPKFVSLVLTFSLTPSKYTSVVAITSLNTSALAASISSIIFCKSGSGTTSAVSAAARSLAVIPVTSPSKISIST